MEIRWKIYFFSYFWISILIMKFTILIIKSDILLSCWKIDFIFKKKKRFLNKGNEIILSTGMFYENG